MQIRDSEFKKYYNEIEEIFYISNMLYSYCEQNSETDEEKACKAVAKCLLKKSGRLIFDIMKQQKIS